ncbi:MAG: SDR family NAD(P)-dependent oxidoreductase, partial [Nitrospira sp.]|nr:SDR family NAD(P)-dependent oxidoreductase [Nitrospira sp.]
LVRAASPRLRVVMLDVTDPMSIADAGRTIAEATSGSGLAALVNNAGISVAGPLELLPLADVRTQFEVNVIGALAVTQALLPLLRLARGRIVNISSIAGLAATPFLGAYCGSKFALEAMSDALRLELAPWGIMARFFKSQGKRVLLVAADPRRPAAGDQLASLGHDLGIDVHRFDQVDASRADVVRICQRGVERAQEQGYDLVVLDTGGRLHVDDELMAELVAVKQAVNPHEVLLVADAMTGQDAVNMAGQFNQQVGLTGVILTKVEGDARGGAVLSIRAVTGQPIKFLGMGEKLDALEPFHPDRMASRILGMGDVLSLIEKAQETFSREEAEAAQKKLISSTFTLEDFRSQLGQMNRLGSFEQILGMLPGGQKLKDLANSGLPEKEMKRVAAMIDSMTARERRDHTLINGSRKKRIARGSGTSVQEVNRLIKQFLQARKIAKVMSGGAGGRRQLAQMLRGM